MDVEAVRRLFAILAVFVELGALAVVVLWGTARFSESAATRWRSFKEAVGPVALWAGFAVAATCMAGSLYLSEVAHYPPCILCWYQRICMYPLVLLLGIAAARKDYRIYRYAAPLAAIGIAISTYHYIHERFPDTVGSVCVETVPCSFVWVWEFHYLSIPAMAGSGFAFILAALAVASPTREEITE